MMDRIEEMEKRIAEQALQIEQLELMIFRMGVALELICKKLHIETDMPEAA
jgi:uncharacterized coiled-coil protein SlyX